MIKTKKENTRAFVVFTEEQVAKVEALSAYLNCEQIADYFGISHDTFTRLKQRQPEVMRAYKKGKSEAIQTVVKSLMQKIMEGDTTATIFFLKTQAGWSTSENKPSSKPKLDFSNDKSPLEIINTALDAVGKGNLTTQEASQIASLANLKATIQMNTASNETPAIQTRKEIERKLKMCDSIISVLEEKKNDS